MFKWLQLIEIAMKDSLEGITKVQPIYSMSGPNEQTAIQQIKYLNNYKLNKRLQTDNNW